MMEKIEWYQEVLELEPSSKVFFPLAKLLQSNNQPEEAIATLRQGLDRHPEFFEARLMLIDLLESSGQRVPALEQVQRLGSKLDLYPGFWQAWAAVYEQRGLPDVSVALRLLAVFLSGREISLVDVLQNGLKNMLGEVQPLAAPAAHPEITLTRVEVPPSAPAVSPVAAGPVAEPVPVLEIIAEQGQAKAASELEPAPTSEPVFEPEDQAELPVSEPEPLADDGPELDVEEEPFSLRTRTMAAVLVEQGDLQGALDIYEELLAAADSPEKQQELQGRIDDLKLKMKGIEPAAGGEKEAEPLQSKQKLLDALENLAKRLEVRAGSS